MTGPSWSWLAVAMGFLLGTLAVLRGTGLTAALGALVIAIAVGLAIGEFRRRREPATDLAPGPVPELSLLERVVPALFILAAVLIVVAALIFTLLQLGHL